MNEKLQAALRKAGLYSGYLVLFNAGFLLNKLYIINSWPPTLWFWIIMLVDFAWVCFEIYVADYLITAYYKNLDWWKK